MLDPEKLFHVGVVVADLDSSATALTVAGAGAFHPVIEGDQQVWTPDGDVDMHFRVRFSTGQLRYELIQESPGTLWETSRSSLHHLAYWASDFERSIVDLVDRGLPVVARTPRWSYHSTPDGYFIELLDETRRPELEARWAEAERRLDTPT